MSKTTFEGYVPSLKARHEATIVGGKAIQSKGGSIRYMLQGEYDGRKTLPKTVSKADFESVYGFDAKEAESAIIIGKNKKGDVDVLGYTTDAKDKTGFTPDKIVKWDDKELRDLQNYSNHKADTVGSPSPADVEPPAPSDTPFPQEPSNEHFNGEWEVVKSGGRPIRIMDKDDEKEVAQVSHSRMTTKDTYRDFDKRMEMANEIVDSHNENFSAETELADLTKQDVADIGYQFLHGGKPQSWTDIVVEDEETGEMVEEGSLVDDVEHALIETDWFSTRNNEYGDDFQDWFYDHAFEVADAIGADSGDETVTPKMLQDALDESWASNHYQVKEAFGLFGKKDEEEKEESDEPKTKEYTVVLQEGDKLELTDLPGDDPVENEEDKDESEEKDEKEGETYEAVQAKVTRIEDEKEEEDEEETDEGLLTPKNLAIGALGVGALALALGAEEDESDYWHDEGQYTMNAEGFYESSSVSGDVELGQQKIMRGRKDYDINTDYDGDLEIDEPDLDVPEVFEEYQDELIEAVKDDVDYSMPIEDGMTGTGSYDVDVEVDLPVRVTGSVDFNWQSDLEDEEEHDDDDWNAEEVSDIEYDEYLDELGSDALTLYKDNPSQLFEKAYPIDYQVQMNDYESSLLADIQSGYTENSMMFDEDENLTPYGERVLKEMYDSLIDETLGIEWLASIHPPSELLKRGDPMAYRVGMSEYEDAFESESDAYAYAYSRGHMDGSKKPMEYKPIIRSKDEDKYRRIIQQKADTVGNPSPSGPSSVPEPAEATGSEPSNENFESQDTGNLKLIGGIGLVAAGLFALGKSDWVADVLNKYMK